MPLNTGLVKLSSRPRLDPVGKVLNVPVVVHAHNSCRFAQTFRTERMNLVIACQYRAVVDPLHVRRTTLQLFEELSPRVSPPATHDMAKHRDMEPAPSGQRMKESHQQVGCLCGGGCSGWPRLWLRHTRKIPRQLYGTVQLLAGQTTQCFCC